MKRRIGLKMIHSKKVREKFEEVVGRRGAEMEEEVK